jgi:hypothetical protein
MRDATTQLIRGTTDLDRVLQVVVQTAQHRVNYLLSWGFSPDHPEVRDARIMFEMQQHVFHVHLKAQRTKHRHKAQPES